ncbi:MAG: RNase adapter RapZ [Candidatus Rokuibacteriota bacterium]|nr:MAG: RNase adapter RapZ [Candidatus Rokubacteria bacterium]
MDEPLSFVVITGLSGAGKSYAIKSFEDMGFFCVDNLPTTLIPTFADLIARSGQTSRRVALGVDVREGEYLSHLLDAIRELRTRGHAVEVLFLEASEEALVRRYHETRRRHPLAAEGNVLEGIRTERKAMSNLREIADRIVDTSGLTVHALKERLVELYVAPKARVGLTTSLVSFGFKHGVPFDADLVFDVRFLPNPHFVPALRALDGRDGRVREFIMKDAEAQEMLDHLKAFMKFLLPRYEREGKAYLTVAIGCTGGRHRSVTLAEELKRFLDDLGYAPSVVHRDLERE